MQSKTKVTFRGGDPEMQKLMKKATRWMLPYILGTRLANAIEINILLIDDLKKKEGTVADCMWTDEIIRPREFEIRIDTHQTPYTRMLALAHELVHVKQYARCELYDYQGKYFGKYARFKKWRYDYSKIPYKKQPWEKEAYAREKPILFAWAAATDSYHLIKQRKDY